jgi:hypothetical protein
MIYSTERIPKRNVSKEADSAFMVELKRTDRPRYESLIRNIQIGAAKLQRQVIEITRRQCEHCALTLPPELRTDAQYCDSTCQRNARRARQTLRPLPMAA